MGLLGRPALVRQRAAVPGGLVEEAAYDAYVGLVFGAWHTAESLTAGDDGAASFRGYYGTYKVTAGDEVYEVELTRGRADGYVDA